MRLMVDGPRVLGTANRFAVPMRSRAAWSPLRRDDFSLLAGHTYWRVSSESLRQVRRCQRVARIGLGASPTLYFERPVSLDIAEINLRVNCRNECCVAMNGGVSPQSLWSWQTREN